MRHLWPGPSDALTPASWRWPALAATVVALLATVQAAAPGMVGGDDGDGTD